MPKASKRKFVVGNCYHTVNRGNEKNNIFFERENDLFFLRRLKHALRKDSTELLCYCLMPNHFHLILKEMIEAGISKGMLSLQTSYAKAINQCYDRSGHLFQGAFKYIHIEQNAYLPHLSRTIHFNPVEAGLVPKPEDWEFSSFRMKHSSHTQNSDRVSNPVRVEYFAASGVHPVPLPIYQTTTFGNWRREISYKVGLEKTFASW